MCPTIIETLISNLVWVVVAYTRKIKYPWLCIKLELKQIGSTRSLKYDIENLIPDHVYGRTWKISIP